MSKNIYRDIAKECKEIISSNTPEKSIELISNIEPTNFDGKKVGKKLAKKIYAIFSDDSVEYGPQYKNDINTYKNKVKKNLSRAIKS